MKKYFMLVICLLMLVSCETKEEMEIRKKNEEIEKIKTELNDNNIPESTKDWLVDINTEKVVTILCLNSSNKCNKLKDEIQTIENTEFKTYYINLDEITEEEKNIYKNQFEIKDYTGYVPYIIISNKNKLLFTKTDVKNFNEINDVLKQLKIVSE